MKKLFTMFLGLVVVTSLCLAMVPIVSAKAPVDTGTPPELVKCCINGECKTMAVQDCINGGGKQVGDCKQCKKTK